MSHTAIHVIHEEHQSLAAMLVSLRMMVAGPGKHATPPDMEVMRAMLFYIDEFPERLHHRKETDLLFPRVLKHAPETAAVIDKLNREHEQGIASVRELQHLLLGWELIGDSRRQFFVDAVQKYIGFYLDHMRTEEQEILPVAEKVLTPEDWFTLDLAFANNRDPLSGNYPPDAEYEKLFQHVLMNAPAPIGLGKA